MCGTRGKACRVTLVNRKSRLLLRREAESKTADCVDRTIIDLLKDLPHKNITPDRGCEFSNCEQINTGLGGIKLYYPEPHQPWQRGTNENANGLLREYFPKRKDVTDIPDEIIQMYVSRFNTRPRKCLGWKPPYEIFHSTSLQGNRLRNKNPRRDESQDLQSRRDAKPAELALAPHPAFACFTGLQHL
ncbi:MAG: IS30 family transposase, partial [Pyramidobacter sp.]|uniref:IS30 family transposase n=1 Tax=Pyramidobacter sp. TaxID=1943581 RepID=UPI0025EB4A9A